MTLFLLSCAVLLVAVLLWVGGPLWRKQTELEANEQALQAQAAANKEALQSQLQEAEDELAAGRLDEAAFKETEQELAKRLVEETKAVESAATSRAPQPVLFVCLGLFVAALSTGLYLDLGKPKLVTDSAVVTELASNEELTPQQAEQRVQQLRQQLEVNAQNPTAWAELARLERRLGDTAAATRSYQHAQMLAPNDGLKTELQLEMVETFALHAEQSGGAIPPMALVVVNDVLSRHEEHPRALWYGSMLAESAGQRDVAMARIEKLLSLNPPEQIRGALEQQLAAWRAEAGASNAAAEPSSSAAAGREIVVNVDIPNGVDLGNTNAATLFVYARAAGGPKMPLAVQRYESPIFPLSVKLNDSMAMVQGTQLGAYEQLEVVARVSFIGDAIPQPGDWFGAKVISKEQNEVAIGIDTLVE
ncbi:MAG: c-type cytochrome biogenesis protein CcmI [Gammaproteobacteria bacterium]|nr:c-type cytochrome biogenesis protein CcmI [Gammaproteobacteria bacterium]